MIRRHWLTKSPRQWKSLPESGFVFDPKSFLPVHHPVRALTHLHTARFRFGADVVIQVLFYR